MEAAGIRFDAVVAIEIPDERIVERMSGRRVCEACGASYHIKNLPPKVEGVCDKCGGELIQRKDDTRETAEKRIEIYEESTAPLIDYYRNAGLLKNFNADKEAEEVFEEIVAEIGE